VLVLLGLELTKQYKQNKSQIHTIKFVPTLATLSPECMSHEMKRIDEILKAGERENWD